MESKRKQKGFVNLEAWQVHIINTLMHDVGFIKELIKTFNEDLYNHLKNKECSVICVNVYNTHHSKNKDGDILSMHIVLQESRTCKMHNLCIVYDDSISTLDTYVELLNKIELKQKSKLLLMLIVNNDKHYTYSDVRYILDYLFNSVASCNTMSGCVFDAKSSHDDVVDTILLDFSKIMHCLHDKDKLCELELSVLHGNKYKGFYEVLLFERARNLSIKDYIDEFHLSDGITVYKEYFNSNTVNDLYGLLYKEIYDIEGVKSSNRNLTNTQNIIDFLNTSDDKILFEKELVKLLNKYYDVEINITK